MNITHIFVSSVEKRKSEISHNTVQGEKRNQDYSLDYSKINRKATSIVQLGETEEN